MTVVLSPDQQQQFSEIASASGQTVQRIVLELIDTYLRERAELLADLEQARADVAAGRVLTSDQVWERLQRQSTAQ